MIARITNGFTADRMFGDSIVKKDIDVQASAIRTLARVKDHHL